MRLPRRRLAWLLAGALAPVALAGCSSIAAPTVKRSHDGTSGPVPLEPTPPPPAPAASPVVIATPADGSEDPLPELGPAAPLDVPVWLNSEPIALEGLRDQAAAVIAFWSFSCVECQRDVPVLTQLYERYQREDFRLISVHYPEFEFQKDLNRVREHVERLRIPYPVAVDEDLRLWNAYGRPVRPAYFGVDWYGTIRFLRAGPGQAATLGPWIDRLLAIEWTPPEPA